MAQEKNTKFKIKKNDKVCVIAGKDKGKIGTVKKVLAKDNKIIVEGVNLVTKATKANPMLGIKGGLDKKELPIAISNVMVCSPGTDEPTRIKYTMVDGKKTRVCKKSGEQLDI